MLGLPGQLAVPAVVNISRADVSVSDVMNTVMVSILRTRVLLTCRIMVDCRSGAECMYRCVCIYIDR